MALKERKQQLTLAAEILQIHLPKVLSLGDQTLARDLLCVLADALRTGHADAEAGAVVWEEKGNQGKADELRREWQWTGMAIEYIESLVKSDNALETPRLERIAWLIPVDLEAPARPKIADPEKMRGACKASREKRRAAKKNQA